MHAEGNAHGAIAGRTQRDDRRTPLHCTALLWCCSRLSRQKKGGGGSCGAGREDAPRGTQQGAPHGCTPPRRRQPTEPESRAARACGVGSTLLLAPEKGLFPDAVMAAGRKSAARPRSQGGGASRRPPLAGTHACKQEAHKISTPGQDTREDGHKQEAPADYKY